MHVTALHPTSPSLATRLADWSLRGLIAATFIAAGFGKLVGAEQMVALFDQIGAGQWFRIVVGLVEISGALLLLLPRAAILGAGILATTMVGAILTHLILIGGSPLPALILLVLNLVALWLRQAEVREVLP